MTATLTVLRPPAERAMMVLLAGAFAVVLMLAAGFSDLGSTQSVVTLVLGGLLLLGGVALALHAYGSQFVLLEDGVEWRNWRGQVRRLLASDIRGAGLVRHVPSNGATVTRLVIARADGSRGASVAGGLWTVAEFEQVLQHLARLGVAAVKHNTPLRSSAIEERYPGALHPTELHPTRYGVLIGLGLIAVAVVVTLIVWFALGMPESAGTQ